MVVPAKPKVAIVGGYGGMGRLFAKLFLKEGFEVVITGPTKEKGRLAEKELGAKYEKDNKKAAALADLVIVTVPIRKTKAVIEEVGPALREGSCIMDFTSVKVGPCAWMEKSAARGAEVVGAHPVFGPTVTDLKGQNIVLCKVRGTSWLDWLQDLFEEKGMNIVKCTPEEHDEAMSVVQAMSHFMLFSAGKALKDLRVDVAESRRFASPVYSLILDLIGRLLAQDPTMYFEIQVHNKNSARVREAFIEAAEEIDSMITGGDEKAFVEDAAKSARNFGDVQAALERTDELLKRKRRIS